MTYDLRLPELGEGVTEGELIKWLVKIGDLVKPDQSVAEIMTDKATVEVPSSKAGVVKDLKFKAGDVIKVETVLMVLDEQNVSATASTPAVAKALASSSKASAPQASSSGAGTTTYSIKLPELGEGVSEGELIKWLVKVGDTIKPDQGLAEIMTDKATVEIPSPKGGVITELKFKAGDVVKVDSPLATIQISGSSTSMPSEKIKEAPVAPLVKAPAAAVSSSSSSASNAAKIFPPVMDSKVLATPSTRRLARELQVDINTLSGTGLAGRVTREDVMKTTESVETKSPTEKTTLSLPKPGYSSTRANEEERVPLKGIRKKIAENLQMAKHIIPHFTLMDEADVTELVNWRESLKEVAEKAGTKITYLPFVMKALIATIREFPMFNASIDDEKQEIIYKKYFNLGFAADTPNGLVVPVIKNADQKSLLELSKEILELSKKARDGKLKPDEMKGATITITNIGSVGGTYATPIINHPEVAILGMYKIQDRLYLDSTGAVKNQKIMNYTITADHRLIDGAVAARFLKSFLARIQKPSILMLDMQ
ncbi:MAG: dihydrolipoyllysine-residue acetyltransferase [Deltaproteobacteria bacterium]|nr:dihydrolipoyllysine-residue acetyltransferase [Deltaproteobacteria bacterium]